MNKRQVLSEIGKIDKKIRKLREKKVKILHKNKLIYCPSCCKLYHREDCEQFPEFGDDGVALNSWIVKCPKGHKWDNKLCGKNTE